MLRAWDKLPGGLRVGEVEKYYDILAAKKISLLIKRLFDIVAASILLIILSPVLLILAIIIKTDSRGPVFFRQIRVTQYGRQFRIFKFRTMIPEADNTGQQITTAGDNRITRAGAMLRKKRLDELPQLLNVLFGDMSFVGTRPEVPRYVDEYTNEMLATLLMPAGITSLASIRYKDEDLVLVGAQNPVDIYVNTVLPAKMKYNLRYIEEFSFWRDIGIMLQTVAAIVKSSDGASY